MRAGISINHRFGAVFLHARGKNIAGYPTSKVFRLTPEAADKIADELRDCARRARREPKPRLKLLDTTKG